MTNNMKEGIKMNKINNKKAKKKAIEDNPIITAPMIDKLAGVINLADQAYCKMVFSGMLSLINEKQPDVVKVPGKGKYVLALKMHYPAEGNILHAHSPFVYLGITHPKQGKRQLRFEYNPAHMTEAGEDHLTNQIDSIFGLTFYELLYHARFTKVDICRNILGRCLEDYIYGAKWSKISSNYFGTDGRMGTLTLGQSTSTQVKIYDKAKEMHGVDTLHNAIRVEVSCKTNQSIHGLAKMENPIERVQILSTDWKNPPYGAAHGRAFLDSCRFRGIRNAIQNQPAPTRAKLKKFVTGQPVWWWDITPEDWSWLWTAALEDAGLLQIPNWAPPLTMKFHVGDVA